MTKTNDEARFAFTANANQTPPDTAFHTAAEWEALIREGAIARGDHADLVVKTLDAGAIWARRNGKAN